MGSTRFSGPNGDTINMSYLPLLLLLPLQQQLLQQQQTTKRRRKNYKLTNVTHSKLNDRSSASLRTRYTSENTLYMGHGFVLVLLGN